MHIMKLDGSLFKTLIINGAENLRQNYQTIDALMFSRSLMVIQEQI